jgi:hypothetical protein
MTSPELHRLREQQQSLTQRLAQGLVDAAPLADLKEMQARLQMVNAALDAAVASQPRSKPQPIALHRHLAALIVVAALVTLAALLPMPRASFALELEAGAAQLLMQDKGNLDGQGLSGEFRAEGFSIFESADPVMQQRARDGGAEQIGVLAERLSLRRIAFPAAATLDFEAGSPMVRLAINGAPHNAPHSAEFEVSGAVSSSFGGAPREASNYPVAEWIKLVSGAAPTQLWLARAPDKNLVWRGLKPVTVRWVERQANADGQVRWVSAIRSGVIRLPATNRELALRPHIALELDGLQLEMADLTLANSVGLKLSGSANRIELNTSGFKQSLKPSLLEYAARNHSLGLVWSAAGLLWGISAWLRKLLGDTL